MKAAEEREGCREREGRLIYWREVRGIFLGLSVKKGSQSGQKHTPSEIMKDILKFTLNTGSLSKSIKFIPY